MNAHSRAAMLRCVACGTAVDGLSPRPFACPNRDGIGEHILRMQSPPEDIEVYEHSNPFIRYRKLLFAYRLACAQGCSDSEYVDRVERLDSRVAEVDGHGFQPTPCQEQPQLSSQCLPPGCQLWVKDETGNVAGSHKARHLMGIALSLESMAQSGRLPVPRPELAIASCGNAALGAAVVAAAMECPLRVFVPLGADPHVMSRLRDLGTRLEICERGGDAVGDPCYRRFRQAIIAGAIPFSCQGPDNVLALDGGRTLGFELAEQIATASASLDRLFVQIGGGALASSLFQGLEEMTRLGLGPQVPILHAVQTRGTHPLARAWRRLLSLAGAPQVATDSALAVWAMQPENQAALAAALQRATADRGLCMWPWETTPKSIADGILDDETYDWLAVVKGMLDSGGWPVLVSEEQLREANVMTSRHTAIAADHTGTAGLAGLLALTGKSEIKTGESLGVIVTGRRRGP